MAGRYASVTPPRPIRHGIAMAGPTILSARSVRRCVVNLILLILVLALAAYLLLAMLHPEKF
jgi:K+-transporting ATPase KdpF subunit